MRGLVVACARGLARRCRSRRRARQNNTLRRYAADGAGRLGKLGGIYSFCEPEIAAGPVPRLHDGRPDLSGPWLGADRTATRARGLNLRAALCRGRRLSSFSKEGRAVLVLHAAGDSRVNPTHGGSCRPTRQGNTPSSSP